MGKLIIEYSISKTLQEPRLKFCYIFKNLIKVKSKNKNSENIILHLNKNGEIIFRQDLDSKLDFNILNISSELYYIFKTNILKSQSDIRPFIKNVLANEFKITNICPIATSNHHQKIYTDELEKFGYEIFKEI